MMTKLPSYKSVAVLLSLIGLLVSGLAKAEETVNVIFDHDFSKGDFDRYGWKSNANHWKIANYSQGRSDLKNNPGPVAQFGKTDPSVKDDDLLVHKFAPIVKPDSLTLSFDGGWGWGVAGQSSDSLDVMLLDDDGNGYVFHVHRVKDKWAAQWGVVAKYVRPATLNWSPNIIDNTQAAILDGGGLKTYTIKRDTHGYWQLSRSDWPSAFIISEPRITTSTFSQVVLVGTPNFDDLCFNKIHLEITSDADHLL